MWHSISVKISEIIAELGSLWNNAFEKRKIGVRIILHVGRMVRRRLCETVEFANGRLTVWIVCQSQSEVLVEMTRVVLGYVVIAGPTPATEQVTSKHNLWRCHVQVDKPSLPPAISRALFGASGGKASAFALLVFYPARAHRHDRCD